MPTLILDTKTITGPEILVFIKANIGKIINRHYESDLMLQRNIQTILKYAVETKTISIINRLYELSDYDTRILIHLYKANFKSNIQAFTNFLEQNEKTLESKEKFFDFILKQRFEQENAEIFTRLLKKLTDEDLMNYKSEIFLNQAFHNTLPLERYSHLIPTDDKLFYTVQGREILDMAGINIKIKNFIEQKRTEVLSDLEKAIQEKDIDTVNRITNNGENIKIITTLMLQPRLRRSDYNIDGILSCGIDYIENAARNARFISYEPIEPIEPIEIDYETKTEDEPQVDIQQIKQKIKKLKPSEVKTTSTNDIYLPIYNEFLESATIGNFVNSKLKMQNELTQKAKAILDVAVGFRENYLQDQQGLTNDINELKRTINNNILKNLLLLMINFIENPRAILTEKTTQQKRKRTSRKNETLTMYQAYGENMTESESESESSSDELDCGYSSLLMKPWLQKPGYTMQAISSFSP